MSTPRDGTATAGQDLTAQLEAELRHKPGKLGPVGPNAAYFLAIDRVGAGSLERYGRHRGRDEARSRLGRSTRELLELIERISKAGASFRSLGDPLWDTSSSQGRLLSTLLAAIADFERDLIRERTGEGRTRAMANGVKFGRKRKLSDYQRAEAIKRRDAGETLAAIAQSYGVAISMISRL